MDDPPHRTFSSSLVNERGQRLFCRYWTPHGQPKALVFLCHGYAEHCLLYEPLAKILVANRYLTLAHDHVGHGQSEGPRCLINSFDTYVDDVFHHIDSIRKQHKDLDCFICGHSMGGAISILSGLRKPEYFKGVILIGPLIATNPEIATPFKVRVAKLLRRVAPQCPVAPMDLTLVTRCPKVLQSLRDDPLRYHGFGKAGFAVALLDACQTIKEKIPSVRYPFLIVQGESDKLCIPEGAMLLYEQALSTDKTLKMYPEAYHNLLYEPYGVAEQVKSEILEWLLARS